MTTAAQTPVGAACAIGVAVVVYCIFVSAIPIYSKKIFDGSFGVREFKYPCTAAALQLGSGAALLCLANVAMHLSNPRARASGRSWLFGPHFLYKLRGAAPTGACFGIKYAVTGWGQTLVDNSTHLLLGATDIVWVVLFAVALNREVPGVLEVVALVVCIAADFIVAYSSASKIDAPFLPIVINLLAPLIGALCISTLREGAKTLFDPSNRLQGTVTKVEFTAIKLTVAALAALVSAMLFENGGGFLNTPLKPWWVALGEYQPRGTLLILASGILTFVFHVDLAWLAALTSATAVGILSEAKVLPQWVLNRWFSMGDKLSTLYIVGAVLGLVGSVMYAGASYVTHTRGKLIVSFRWSPALTQPCQTRADLCESFTT